MNTTTSTDEASVIIVEEANLTSKNVLRHESWILDSGATEHMSWKLDSFVNYTPLNPPRKVIFGNNDPRQGLGFGDVLVYSNTGNGYKQLWLKNVLYVPELRRKLISIASATDQGSKGEIGRNDFVLKDKNGQVALIAHKQGRLYVADVTEALECEAAESEDLLKLMHERFGHINKKSLVKMSLQGSVNGMAKLLQMDLPHKTVRDSIDCEACVKGKQSKKSYKLSRRNRSNVPGETIHVDIYNNCVGLYSSVGQLLSKLPNCIPPRRKRNPLALAVYEGATELAEIVGAGATVWLKGLASSAARSGAVMVANDLLAKVKELVYLKASNETLVPFDHELREIDPVSLVARSRPEQLSKIASNVNKREIIVDYFSDKLKAAIVLVLAINDACKQGKLDTQALGELLDNKELSNINPNNTIVKSIFHDAARKLVTLEFDVFQTLSFWERLHVGAVLYIVLLIGILNGLIVAVVKISKGFNKVDNLEENIGTLEQAVNRSTTQSEFELGIAYAGQQTKVKGTARAETNLDMAYGSHSTFLSHHNSRGSIGEARCVSGRGSVSTRL